MVYLTDYGYVHQWESYKWVSGSIEALKSLNSLGYSIIVTNQAGIARGYYDEADFHKLMEKVILELKQCGVDILDYYYCPHHVDGIIEKYKVACNCRKPKPE